MEGESGMNRRIIDDVHSWDIQGYQTETESGVPQSIIEELHSSGMQRDQMEG